MNLEILFLFAFLVICFFSFFYFVFKLIERISQQFQINFQQLSEKIDQQSQVNQEIKEKLSLQEHLKNGLEKTKEIVEDLKRISEIREKIREEREKEFSEMLKRVESVITGTTSKGISGEEILRETFKKLPPEMIESNFQVKGKIVEFALILPNGKRLPIDSKWPASKLILDLEKETKPEKRKEIIEEIEKEVIKRIKEVRQYIDPNLTWSQAIAAIPDSVYSVCKNAHLKARENNVILMPYSMVLPLLLYIYRFHLQYAISLDIENLQSHLISISKNLDEMENILENKIYRGTTMISNAYLEYKQLISHVKSSIEGLKLKEQQEIKKLK